MMRKLLCYMLVSFLAVALTANSALAADLHISTGPEAPDTVITLDTPDTVPDVWYPLRAAAEYLPIDVAWDGDTKEVVIRFRSESAIPMYLAERRYPAEQIAESEDAVIINGVTYCSPRFLARHFATVGFTANGEVWCCTAGTDFDGIVTASLLELWVKAPDKYDFVVDHLPGGIQAAEYDINLPPGILAYTYPYRDKPVCYIADQRLSGATLASVIAHEAWHVYQARNGLEVSESGAKRFQREVLGALLQANDTQDKMGGGP